jgi:hypothetical protein
MLAMSLSAWFCAGVLTAQLVLPAGEDAAACGLAIQW